MLRLAGWLTAGAGAAGLVAVVDPASGVLAVGVLLAAAPTLLHPHLADRVLAALLSLLLFPVMLLLALVVRVTSRGPVLIRDPDGDTKDDTKDETEDDAEVPRRPALRFRITTKVDPAAETCEGDRFTPVGRVLHRLCLDELPRLLDVARGEAPLRNAGSADA